MKDWLNDDTIGEAIKEETPTSKILDKLRVKYNPVYKRREPLLENDIIKAISGGDQTDGSCVSVALAYVGQKNGWNVFDFRGGDSNDFFSDSDNIIKIFHDVGAPMRIFDRCYYAVENGEIALNQIDRKEYFYMVGTHASIVRKNNGSIQYLELQGPKNEHNGWKNFNDIDKTLVKRFGCDNTQLMEYSPAYVVEIEQLTGNKFRTILGYLNTSAIKQRKGAVGYEK